METELILLDDELTRTEKALAEGTIFARVRLYVITRIFGAAFSITELRYAGTGAFTLFVTVLAVILAIWAPEEVCNGFDVGLVYETVTASPYTTGLDRVSVTLVPDTATELIVLFAEFTWTTKAEDEGTIFARAELYVNSRRAGAVFWIAELT
jgi:hypothetical protein